MANRAAEVALRRAAERQGLMVRKSRQDGTWSLYDASNDTRWFAYNGKVIKGPHRKYREMYGLSLNKVKIILAERNPQPKKERLDWGPIMAEAKRIVNSYNTKVTLRQLFYQLVSRQLIPNQQTKYSYLSRLTAEARRDGWFPDLIDQTSEIYRPTFFTSPEKAKEGLRQQYRRDRTEGQEVTIYLAVEKAGIQNQLWSWFGYALGIPILALGGYGSQTYKDDVKDDVAEHLYVDGERVRGDWHEIDHRPAVLIYAGDHDASGDDIFRDFVMRTDPYARLNDDYTGVTRSRLWEAVHRIALTKEQVAEYDLPENPGKDTDTRAEEFMDRHGYGDNVQVELDALSPDVLRGLYQDAIDEYWDSDIYDEVCEREEEERDQLFPENDDDDEDTLTDF